MQIFNKNVAVATGRNLVPPGPRVPATNAIIESEGLRAASHAAAAHVAALSQLPAVAHWQSTAVADDVDVLVVDRPGWITANAESLQAMLSPAFEILAEEREDLVKGFSSDITGRFSGAQLGAALAFISTKVLGQYEPYAARTAGTGMKPRLMLVSPNVMNIREELNLNAQDFHLWVSLHELTHAAQFAQAPWLADHILGTATEFLLTTLLPERTAHMTAEEQTTHSKTLESQLVAVMSLLEGHANVMMDSVDRKIVPTVKTIRRRFDAKSEKHTWFGQLIRKLIGLEAKAKQYKQGQSFVSTVVDRVGLETFNTVWHCPENLPLADELDDADAWIGRVLR